MCVRNVSPRTQTWMKTITFSSSPIKNCPFEVHVLENMRDRVSLNRAGGTVDQTQMTSNNHRLIKCQISIVCWKAVVYFSHAKCHLISLPLPNWCRGASNAAGASLRAAWGLVMRHWSSGEICSPPSFRVSLTAHLQYRSRPSRRRCLSAVHLTFGSCDLLVGCVACLSAHIFPSFSLSGRVCVAVPPLLLHLPDIFVILSDTSPSGSSGFPAERCLDRCWITRAPQTHHSYKRKEGGGEGEGGSLSLMKEETGEAVE